MTPIMTKLTKILVVVMITISATSTPLALMVSSSLVKRSPENTRQGDEFDHLNEDLEDYSIWNPSPVYRGVGNGAPIPHPQV
ncbi:unnamed protein product [Lupinus luteus]|uniref:Transmembrane protein n=1 Tax=Lupinus luteus TaxID=3873 RepID=A0AAV1W9C4_LUPLU